MSKKGSTPRSLNKAARSERREEIVARWEVRRVVRWCEIQMADHADDAEGWDGLRTIMEYAQWAPLSLLVDTVPSSFRRHLIVTALRTIQLKEMPYDEYLQTPEWRGRADRCKARFYHRCALDETHTADHAHHRTYERRGRELATDLIPLCADCHAKHHGRRA
jgi:hypothetical protein